MNDHVCESKCENSFKCAICCQCSWMKLPQWKYEDELKALHLGPAQVQESVVYQEVYLCLPGNRQVTSDGKEKWLRMNASRDVS